MRGSRVDLLSNASATGSDVTWPGGRGSFIVAGTFGGATVKLQLLGPDGSTYIDAGSYTTLTAAGIGNFDLPQGKIRANVSGGSPSGLYAVAVTVDL
jgi:hypothetical protein